MQSSLARSLTVRELNAIRRVENRGYRVDFEAIRNKLLENAIQGNIDKPVFHTIYAPLYPLHSNGT